MLGANELKDAVQTAEKTTSVCTRFCRVVAEVDEGAYICSHNGTGPRDTDLQRIWAPGMLDLSTEKLAEKLRAWVIEIHSGNRIDLNAL